MTPVTFGQLAESMDIIRSLGFVQLINDKALSITTTRVGIAGFTVLIWDHVDTFTSEVEYIWLGEKSLLVYLFLINRYLTPLAFIINLYAYLSPVWDETMCKHFVRFEGAMTLTGIGIVGLMMLIRIYTLYNKHRYIVIGLATLFVMHVGVHAWLLTKGIPVHHVNKNVHSCSMIFEANNAGERVLTSATAWLPLVYDTVVFLLTLYKTLPAIRKASLSREIMKQLLEDGIIYYGVILAVALALTIMMIAADDGVKNVTAQLQLILSVTMMSRITLNLKKSRGRINGPARVMQLFGVEMTTLQSRKSSSTYRQSSDDVESWNRRASLHTRPPSAHFWRP